jgi:hypothetical protein
MTQTTAAPNPPMALCSVIDRGIIIAATATKLSPTHSLTAALHCCLVAGTLLPYQVIDPSDRQRGGTVGSSLIGDALHRYALRNYRPGGNRSTAQIAEALRDAITAGAIVFVSSDPEAAS